MMNNPKVIIIGAGASGLAAATKLLEHKIGDVTILEAEKRIGGRIHSVDFGGSIVDLGAQWCHGENTIVYEMVKGLDLIAPPFNRYDDLTFYESTGHVLNKQITDRLITILNGIAKDQDALKESEETYAQYIKRRYKEIIERDFANENNVLKVAERVCEWFLKSARCYGAYSIGQEHSAKGMTHLKNCGKDYHWKNRGFRTILYVLMKQIPDYTQGIAVDDKVYYSKEVTKIVWDDNKINNGGVSVECSDGSFYNADHVIVTIPLGVLKKRYTTLFQPELPPTHVTAIESLGFEPLNKILLKFPNKWWPNDCKGFSFVWDEEDRTELAEKHPEGVKELGKSWLEDLHGFFAIDSHPRILLGWIVGPAASFMETLSDQTVKEGSMYLLRKFVGRKYNIEQPEDMLRSCWSTNPHFYGAGSYRSVYTENDNTSAEVLAQPLVSGSKQVVLFSGEATHPNCYSSVHGAIETGYREAERIINIYRS